MADQFDLEQGIMGCWNVTSDLDVLFEELCVNDAFDKDKASNFVLGLSTIYEAKFNKLFRTFEEFLKTYYIISKELKQTQRELLDLRDEMEEIEEANSLVTLTEDDSDSLAYIFDEEEDNMLQIMEESLMGETDNVFLDNVEQDEFGDN